MYKNLVTYDSSIASFTFPFPLIELIIKIIVNTKIILLLQKLGTKTNPHKNVPIIAHIVQIADILPAVFQAVCRSSNFNFKIIGLIAPMKNDGMKNNRIVLRMAHNFILGILFEILDSINP